MIEAGFIAFIPALTAIIAVLVIRDVIASLAAGIFAGALIFTILTGGGIFSFLQVVSRTIFDSAAVNVPLISYLFLMGAIVSVITMSGGHIAYGRWVSGKIKSARGVSLAVIAFGVLIFIDDYFSCLLTGTIMGQSADRFKISRAKLAYFIDSTAAPVCILAPVSSWTMTIANICEESGMGSGFLTFVKSIPYNFYAIFTICFVIYIALTHKDFGFMKKCEAMSENSAKITEDETQSSFSLNAVSKKGRVLDLILPNAALVLLTLFSMLYLGGYFGAEKITLLEAIEASDIELSINYGCFAALLLCFLMFVPRGLLSARHFLECSIEGMKSMFTAVLILILAWTLSSITTTNLGAGAFIEDLMSNVHGSVQLSFLPLVIFVISALVSFGLGSWGTFLVTIPLVAIIAQAVDTNLFFIYLGSTLAGSVFGDHASPVTDTTILASLGAKCSHIIHVKSQLPYALLTCAAAVVSYVFIGQTDSLLLSYIFGIGLIAVVVLLIEFSKKRKLLA